MSRPCPVLDPRRDRFALRAVAALLLGGALAACGPAGGPPGAAPAAGASAPASAAAVPPVSVSLVRAAARDFTVTLDASGTVTAQSSVDVKPQTSAQVLAVHVKEGQFVQRGQALFTLDARVDEANLKRTESQLSKDEATLADARRQLARSQELLAQNFISQSAVDTATATAVAQQSAVAADRAAIEAVKVQLSFSRINAPGAGRVGPISVFVGSSVSPAGALLTITQIDPVAVAFNLPQRNLPDALRALASGRGVVSALLPDSAAGGVAAGAAAGAAAGVAGPAVGGAAVRQGKLSFVDSTVDAASGTVKVKAVFNNADQALWPGAYVTVKMALQTLTGAIVVPQAAIVQGARGTAVFVAGPGNLAALRPVKILASAGADAVVSGLTVGDRVVLDGRQNVRPGALLVERAPDAGRPASGGPPGATPGAPPGASTAASGGAGA